MLVTRDWTPTRLRELTGGNWVHLRNSLAEPRPAPLDLLGPGAQVGTNSLADRLESMHPDDQPTYTTLFLGSFARPEELIEGSYRCHADGQWFLQPFSFLNLIGYPEVAGILILTSLAREPIELEFTETPSNLEGGYEGEFTPSTWVLMVTDAQTIITQVEGMTEELFGRSPDELLGLSTSHLTQSDRMELAAVMWQEILARPGVTRSAQGRHRHPDGSLRWLEMTLINGTKPSGPTEIIHLLRDVTVEHEQEQLRQQLTDEFRMLAEEVPAAVFRTDRHTRVTFHNALWDSLIGAARDVDRLGGLFDPTELLQFEEAFEVLAASAEEDGRSLYLELRGAEPGTVLAVKLRSVGEPGSERQSFVGSVEDITATIRLRRRAECDDLTGLLNRQALEDHLESVLRTNPDRVLVVFLDLDGFKLVNDTFGHDIGDLVLTTLADRLRRGVRPDDVVGRYGGDEFVLVCQSVEHTNAETVAGRIERLFTGPITWDGGSWTPAGSVGAARPLPGESLMSVIRRADQAMLAIKRQHHRQR